jgi:hypothetical protein
MMYKVIRKKLGGDFEIQQGQFLRCTILGRERVKTNNIMR